ISNSPGLRMRTLDAPTICADSESISSSKEILCIQTVSHLSPTSQTSLESSNGQPSPISTTSIPTPPPPTPPPPPITRQLPRASNTNVVDGIDFHNTFSPVVKSTTIRAVLSLAVTNDWPLRQLDIENAFFHGNLNEQGTIDNIICQHGSAFALKDLGPLNYFLGFEIVPQVSSILLSQKKYILELLQSAGLSNYNPMSSPMVTLSSLSLDDSTAFSNPVKFLPFKILQTCYGKVIPILLLKLSQMRTGSNLISWTARKQHTVSRSSTETEYKALADTVAKLTWLQALLNELGIRSSLTPILWCNNLGATYLSINPIFHGHTKYIEIDYHFVREKGCSRRSSSSTYIYT
ncbi:integrase, partial [Tanacetum coccineum]